jgi:hypothetical protein
VSQIWYHLDRIWPYVLLAILAGAGLTLLLARLRPSRSVRRSIAEVGMLVGTAPWVWMILTPMKIPESARTVYLVPLSDLWAQVAVGRPLWVLVQVGGNLAVLFLLGFFAPMRFGWASPVRLLLLGAVISLTLEVMQHLFTGGRVFSVDDVLVNALGCGFGALLCPRRWRAAPPSAGQPASAAETARHFQ